jgi:hypothetical protein
MNDNLYLFVMLAGIAFFYARYIRTKHHRNRFFYKYLMIEVLCIYLLENGYDNDLDKAFGRLGYKGLEIRQKQALAGIRILDILGLMIVKYRKIDFSIDAVRKQLFDLSEESKKLQKNAAKGLFDFDKTNSEYETFVLKAREVFESAREEKW